jgi:hypothetical protein
MTGRRELLTWTDASFETMSWHDCVIRSIGFSEPDLTDGSVPELEFDIDYIVDWPCEPGGSGLFSVAPATLSFLLVTDLRLELRWPETDFAVVPGLPVISELLREPAPVHRVLPNGPYFRWTLRLSEPPGGRISFGAAGFRMELRAAPVQTAEQSLSAEQRQRHR